MNISNINYAAGMIYRNEINKLAVSLKSECTKKMRNKKKQWRTTLREKENFESKRAACMVLSDEKQQNGSQP